MIRAVQQFQLGTVLKSEKDALCVMERMKKAGYEGIELCNFMIHPTPLMVRLLTKAAGMPVGNGGKLDWPHLVRETGMKVPAVHNYLNTLENDPETAIAEAHTFGAAYIVITGMYRFDYDDEAAVHTLAVRLNKAGAVLKENGTSLLYHNHNIEFLQLKGGRSAYDILIEETDPALVNFEFDSYWATDAGVNALALMERLGPRLKLYHINDRGFRQQGPAMTPILKADSMELGTGSMDLAPLVTQAEKAGVDAIILESHKNWIDGDPCKSFEVSARFLDAYFSKGTGRKPAQEG